MKDLACQARSFVAFSDPWGLKEEEVCPPCAIAAAAYAVFELASSAYDIYSAGEALLDENATTGDKALAVGGAAIGFVAPGGGYGAAARSLDDLADAAKVLDRGGELTRAGRALEKHGSRVGSAFPRAVGSVLEKNAAGQHIVEDILTDPGSARKYLTRGRFTGGMDITAPDGRGIRFNADGGFVGFLEP